jgi:hypothetical protein
LTYGDKNAAVMREGNSNACEIAGALRRLSCQEDGGRTLVSVTSGGRVPRAQGGGVETQSAGRNGLYGEADGGAEGPAGPLLTGMSCGCAGAGGGCCGDPEGDG